MELVEKILNIICPPVCGFCNTINDNFICKACESRFNEIKISNIDDYRDVPVYFDEHFYILKYETDVRDYILKYKFEEISYLYKSFAKLIVNDKIFINNFIKKYDYIINVPIHRKRLKTRGYDQSKLIAKEVAKLCCKNYYGNILVKNKNIVAQSTLDKLERIGNIKDAFSTGGNVQLIKNKKIAMFDDIFTTGATSNECAKILKNAGADKVGVFTLAKD